MPGFEGSSSLSGSEQWPGEEERTGHWALGTLGGHSGQHPGSEVRKCPPHGTRAAPQGRRYLSGALNRGEARHASGQCKRPYWSPARLGNSSSARLAGLQCGEENHRNKTGKRGRGGFRGSKVLELRVGNWRTRWRKGGGF